MNFYNEIDPYAAQWLRNLIAAGHIAPGIVDERSIEDLRPSDLAGFTQCHFFAGIGVWSHSLRAAGWSDDRPVWTGSCPCQPFSAAGKGAGFADERHLWPAWHHLIRECHPTVIFGEQVASKAVDSWIDLVQDDLEGMGYAFGAVPFPSAGVGAPHIRDRAYWVADADQCAGRQRCEDIRGWSDGGNAQPWSGLGGGGVPERLAHSSSTRLEGLDARALGNERSTIERGGSALRLADASSSRRSREREKSEHRESVQDVETCGLADDDDDDDDDDGLHRFAGLRIQGAKFYDADGRSPVGGFWSEADWIPCRDNKWRPVEPGTFPLAHGATSRVGRLRAYGNAINAEAARVFIESVM